MVKYFTYNEIDFTKWDECIINTENSLIYAHSFYLNCISKNWDALILNDYEAVMPLTYNKKYGIYYLYQPPFTASLGVFGKTITKEMVTQFLKAIPKKFKYVDIYLNYKNVFSIDNYNLYSRKNYVLILNKTYENIYTNYRDNVKRNIKRCTENTCAVVKNISIDDVIKLSKQQATAFSNLTDTDFENVRKVFEHLKKKDKAITYGVYLQNNLVCSAAFFFDDNRAYYILVGNDPIGRTVGASHALIDSFIKDHCNSNLFLDFEGSDIESIAFFYSSFGATEENFAGLRVNNLPKLIKWMKK